MTCRFFCHFGVFFVLLPPWQPGKSKFLKSKKKTSGDIIISHMCTINGNHMIYGSKDIKCERHFFLILRHFLAFNSVTTRKIKIFKKWKKHLETWSYTSVQKVWRCGGWRMPFLLFSFYSFTLLITWKIKTFKKWKKRLEIFYTCVLKIMIPWCTFPEIWCGTDGRMDLRTDGRQRAGRTKAKRDI